MTHYTTQTTIARLSQSCIERAEARGGPRAVQYSEERATRYTGVCREQPSNRAMEQRAQAPEMQRIGHL
jgi:hypothetical protein